MLAENLWKIHLLKDNCLNSFFSWYDRNALARAGLKGERIATDVMSVYIFLYFCTFCTFIIERYHAFTNVIKVSFK